LYVKGKWLMREKVLGHDSKLLAVVDESDGGSRKP
jgi:hypothetical protein